MQIALTLDHRRDPRESVALVRRLEPLGLDMVWVPETWGADAPTLAGHLAAVTERLRIGVVLPVYSRTPALIAQTAATLDLLSGGRALLGLATSGPQVVEGWHGVPFARPVARLEGAIAACRTAWSRQPLVAGGPHPVPLPPGRGTGLGRPLRMALPSRPRIPIAVAALAPGSVALAARAAEIWWPLLAPAERLREVWADALARGLRERDPALGPLQIAAGGVVAVGGPDEVAAGRAAARREIAFYMGAMGARDRNFYADTGRRLGYGREVGAVQDAALGGRRDEAAALVPDPLVDALSICGSDAEVRRRLAAHRDAGVTLLTLSAATPDPDAAVPRLRALLGPG